MLHFLKETWFIWWAVAIVVGLRWNHVLVTGSHLNAADKPAPEEKEMWKVSVSRWSPNTQ